MIARTSRYGRQHQDSYSTSRKKPTPERSLQTFPTTTRSAGGVRCPAAAERDGSSLRLPKLLLNVTIERSLGPVQVIMRPDQTVADLVKSAMDIYVREKRRPLLADHNPHRFELHFSQFSLESLKAEEKLVNLGSRNFFLCSKPITSVNSSFSGEAKKGLFPLTKLMDFLL